MTHLETPRQLGYRWPAEWEPHRATWVAWPHNRDTWPGGLEPARRQFAQLVTAIARCEPVHVLAGRGEPADSARAALGQLSQVQLHDIPTNDAWIRDHGPIFLAAHRPQPQALLDWKYNAWGNKYPPFELDNAVPRRIAALTTRRRFAPDMVLEGGSVDGNGQGVVLTTDSCLLNPNRNPGLDRQAIERNLCDYLAAEHVVWLTGEIPGDDTDGHVDQIARFVGPSTVVMVDDPDGRMLQENRKRLQSAGCLPNLEVIPLPWPAPKYCGQQRLPASYANFYIVNGGVLVPTFGDPLDRQACQILAACFPDREVVPLPADALALGRGAVHCLTQQEPHA